MERVRFCRPALKRRPLKSDRKLRPLLNVASRIPNTETNSRLFLLCGLRRRPAFDDSKDAIGIRMGNALPGA